MNNNNIRLRIGDILYERKIKQNEFARMSGLSQNTVSSLATNGVRQIHLSTIEKVCRALNVQPGDIFTIEN